MSKGKIVRKNFPHKQFTKWLGTKLNGAERTKIEKIFN